MDNQEEVYHMLEEYENQKPKEIPRELEDYLNYVAKTGDPLFMWPKVKFLFQQKLQQVLCDYYESCPNNDILQCPNVDTFNFDIMKNKILERLETFASAPFTIQRLCELLTCPRKEYNRTDKFMRAVEKNILVVTTREPGNLIRSELSVVMNGAEDGGSSTDQGEVQEPMQVDSPPSGSGARPQVPNELAAVSCGDSGGKPMNGIDDDDDDDDNDNEEDDISEEDEEDDSNSLEAVPCAREGQSNTASTADTCSPQKVANKSSNETSSVNGHYELKQKENEETIKSSSPPASSNFSADKLAESSESSSLICNENAEQFTTAATCQEYSSTSEETYQESSTDICEPSDTRRDIETSCSVSLDDISLPPEPSKSSEESSSIAQNCETTSTLSKSIHQKETEENEISDVQTSEPPPKRLRFADTDADAGVDFPIKSDSEEQSTEKHSKVTPLPKSPGNTVSEHHMHHVINTSNVHQQDPSQQECATFSESQEKNDSSDIPHSPPSLTKKNITETSWTDDSVVLNKPLSPSLVNSSEDKDKSCAESLNNGPENDLSA